MASDAGDHFRLGRYSGSSMNVAPPMIASITTINGQVLNKSRYHAREQRRM